MFTQVDLETRFCDAAVRAVRAGMGLIIGVCLNVVFPVGDMNRRVRTVGTLVYGLVGFLLVVSPVSYRSLPQHL